MNRLALILSIAFTFQLLFLTETGICEEPGSDDSRWHLISRLGFSPATGVIGSELHFAPLPKQLIFQSIAVTVGVIINTTSHHHFTTLGLKQYLKPEPGGFYISEVLVFWTGNNNMTLFGEGHSTLGVLVGYNWRFGKRWDLNVGAGMGRNRWWRYDTHYEMIDGGVFWIKDERLDNTTTEVMFELAIGFRIF